MNEIMNNVLLIGDKLIPEMHLRQPRSTYSTCVPFNKNNERKIPRNRRLKIYLTKRTR